MPILVKRILKLHVACEVVYGSDKTFLTFYNAGLPTFFLFFQFVAGALNALVTKSSQKM